MAPHSSTLAWEIPWTEDPGRLQSMVSHRVGVTRVSNFTSLLPIGEGNGDNMHSSILAWRIPWREEPGRLQSMGSQRVRHD